MTYSLKTYKEAACTNLKSVFNYGDNVYVNGSITTSLDTVGTSVVLTVYTMAGVEIETIMDITHGFTANTPATLKSINDNLATPTFDLNTTDYPGGRYKITLKIDGTDIDSIYYDEAEISVVDAPVISAVSISDTTITQDASVYIDATISNECDRAIVTFFDSNGDPVYACEMQDQGEGEWQAQTDPLQIPIDDYTAGYIWVTALNDEDTIIDITSGVSDKTLELEVTDASGLWSGAINWLAEDVYVKYHTGAYTDGGMPAYGNWVKIAGRPIRNTQKIMDAQGDMVVSSAKILITGANTIGIEDRIKLSNDYSDTAEARIIRVDTITDLSGNAKMKVVYI